MLLIADDEADAADVDDADADADAAACWSLPLAAACCCLLLLAAACFSLADVCCCLLLLLIAADDGADADTDDFGGWMKMGRTVSQSSGPMDMSHGERRKEGVREGKGERMTHAEHF